MTKETKNQIISELNRGCNTGRFLTVLEIKTIADRIADIVDKVVGEALMECGQMGEIMQAVGLKIVSVDNHEI